MIVIAAVIVAVAIVLAGSFVSNSINRVMSMLTGLLQAYAEDATRRTHNRVEPEEQVEILADGTVVPVDEK